MINIIKSITYSFLGMAVLGWVGILFASITLAGPDPDGFLTEYFADNIIIQEKIDALGYSFAEISEELFLLVGHMNLTLIFICIFFTLIWSTLSHFLNIDAPGKAKIYFIHWSAFTGIYIFSIFLVTYFFTQTTTYNAADLIGAGGYFQLSLLNFILYFLIYYFGVIFGTARFARSSVLFANKLPGGL